MTELQKEKTSLAEGLSYIEKEIIWHRAQGSSTPKGDRFRISMTEFSGLATEKLSSLQAQFKEMTVQVRIDEYDLEDQILISSFQMEKVALMFGEDPKTVQPEELFGHFSSFIEAFKEAQKDLENQKKREEEEERKRKEAQVNKTQTYLFKWKDSKLIFLW